MHPRLGLGAAALLLTAPSVAGCGSDGPAAPTRSFSPTADPGTTSREVDKVLVFIIENHSFDETRAQMPYLAGLGDNYGYADQFFALQHPSLPNYLAIAGGDTYGIEDDDPPTIHPVSGPSVFGEAIKHGRTAKVYADAMTSPCQGVDSGTYAVKHNPWAYFVDERQLCDVFDVPVTDLATDVQSGDLPAVGMVIPDMCHNAHDCDLSAADAWLGDEVDQVLSGPDWASGRLAVVVTADEDDDSQDNRILTVVAQPSLDHVVVSDHLDHYALAHALADVAGAPPLGNAADAPSLLESFGLSAVARP